MTTLIDLGGVSKITRTSAENRVLACLRGGGTIRNTKEKIRSGVATAHLTWGDECLRGDVRLPSRVLLKTLKKLELEGWIYREDDGDDVVWRLS